MSAIPFAFHGQSIDALVVGGGKVATRRVRALLDAGARVRVIAPVVSELLSNYVERGESLTIETREYCGRADIADSTIVVAATDSASVNSTVATDAHSAKRPVNVVASPNEGTFDFMASHREGDIAVGVAAGGLPGAAIRIRDAIAERFDERYGAAVAVCGEMRRKALASDSPAVWNTISEQLLSEDFCEKVESGRFLEEAAQWP